MRLVLEAHRRRLEHAGALDVDAFVAVDQDVVDGRVLEQRLDRPEAGHLVDDLVDEVFELLRVERDALGEHVLGDQCGDLPPHLAFGYLLDRREIDLLDQPAVQPHLGVEQLVAQRRDRRRGLRVGASSFGSSATICRLGALDRRKLGREAAAARAAAAACASAMRRVAVKRPNMLTSAHQRELALGSVPATGFAAFFGLRRDDQLGERLLRCCCRPSPRRAARRGRSPR